MVLAGRGEMKLALGRVLALVAATVALPAAAGAACAQNDLAGRWTVAVDTLGNGGQSATDIFSLTCTMTLNENGRITQSECRQLGNATGGEIAQGTHARFVVDRDCNLSAANPDNVPSPVIIRRGPAATGAPVIAGQMSRDRSAIMFDGALTNGNARFRVQGFRS